MQINELISFFFYIVKNDFIERRLLHTKSSQSSQNNYKKMGTMNIEMESLVVSPQVQDQSNKVPANRERSWSPVHSISSEVCLLPRMHGRGARGAAPASDTATREGRCWPRVGAVSGRVLLDRRNFKKKKKKKKKKKNSAKSSSLSLSVLFSCLYSV